MVFGITAYASLESDTAASTGFVAMPVQGEASIGGHCICLVGFDQATRRFKFANS